MSKKIKSVCIVGGGSSGWMTAATFATQFPKMDVTIIESPDFPILGVGESTLGGIKHWTSLIGLEDKDFLKETDGSDNVQSYLCYDMIIPAESTVEICEKPKYLAAGYKLRGYANQADRLEITASGKQITS